MTHDRSLDLSFTTLFPQDLRVVHAVGRERISKLSRLDLRITCASESEDLLSDTALQSWACLSLRGGEGDTRTFMGMVTAAGLEGRAEAGRSVYRLRIQPRMWILRRRRTSRVFQDMTVVEVTQQLLREHRVAHRLRLASQHAKRPYVVQHDETDYAFVARLLAEQGIFFYFDHPASLSKDVGMTGMGDSEVVVLSDTADYYPPLAGSENLHYRPEQDVSALAAGGDQVSRFALETSVRHEQAQGRARDYHRPAVELAGRAATTVAADGATPQPAGATTARGHRLPPLGHYEHEQGLMHTESRDAAVMLEQLRARAVVGRGDSLCRRLMPARRFVLHDHDEPALNQAYAVTSVAFEATAPEHVQAERPAFASRFECVPATVCHRPPRPKRRLRQVLETATVVGPPGEEIHTDELGRIKVQFHWDLDGQRDDHSSCWLRIAQPWAGAGWGLQLIPRVGTEVLITFVGGDPDRPMVTGMVHNAIEPPPFPLPDAKSVSGIRTRSTPGGEGRNELWFEDAKGRELVYVQAERNYARLVKVDDADQIGRDQFLRVARNRAADVGEVDAIVVGKEHRVTVKEPSETGSTMSDQHIAHSTGGATFGLSGGNASLAVKGDVAIDAGGNVVVGAGGDIQLKAEGQIGITAAAAVTITAAGPVSVKGTDVVIKGGTVKIN